MNFIYEARAFRSADLKRSKIMPVVYMSVVMFRIASDRSDVVAVL
jgi:hypothetical protein